MMPEERPFTKEDVRIWWLLIRWVGLRLGLVVAVAFGAANLSGWPQKVCTAILVAAIIASIVQFIRAFSPGMVQHGQGGCHDDDNL